MKLSPLSNLKYSHLKLGTVGLQEYSNFSHISVPKFNRNMILVSKHTFLRSTITLDTFVKFVFLAAIVKSKMATIEPFFIYLIKTNIECFYFESIMHVIVTKSV